MKVSAIITNPSRDIVKTINVNRSTIQSASIIILGIICGVLLYVFNTETLSGDLFEYFISFTTDFSYKSKPEIFSGLMLSDLIYLIAMVIFGTCAVGTSAVICLSLINSMGIGMLTAYIYDSFALEGIEYCLIVLLPGKFLLILAMILLTQNCVITSKLIWESANNKADRVVDFRKYIMRILIITIIFFLSTLVDFITVTAFSSLFEFA